MYPDSAEHIRLAEIHDDIGSWRRWGPYLSERAWATVREDYSPDGNAWEFLTHDQARSKAYRWGEDGIAGICDRYQLLCFAPAFWNGRDPILKERLFGLTPLEGNHGEDVKEYYYYLDNLPSHAYMKYLYKYPQQEYPYRRLIDENRARNGQGPEFELIDTGIFDQDQYFDIFIEYAKASPDDIAIRIEAWNRGSIAAPLHIFPQLWLRNTWSWGQSPASAPPTISRGSESPDGPCLVTDLTGLANLATVPIVYRVGRVILDAPPGAELLFTDNETNSLRVFDRGRPDSSPHVKDAFHRYVIHGELCTNPHEVGTKAALHYRFDVVPPGGSVILRLRLSDRSTERLPLAQVDDVIAARKAEADAFYDTIHPRTASADERRIQRQALAGLLWSKQAYVFDVNRWLEGDDPSFPPPESRRNARNRHWRHLNSLRVMSVPDKWEYPWFAAWDLAFHCVGYALVDPAYAMDQLWLLLFEQFQHPNGQIPAYEWEFSDTNPPVHAWAVWRVFNMARIRTGQADRAFLERCFHKLLMNFAWWINKVDQSGNNVFEGGFLGLDNITVMDRSTRCRDGSVLEQSDGSGWMGMFCLNMMRIALELARENPVYEGLATKFFQHYVYVAAAMKHMGNRPYTLWDDLDGFFYDVLRRPDQSFEKLRVRSLVGLVPLFAVERLERAWIEPFASFRRNLDWFLSNRPDLVEGVVHTVNHDGAVTHVLTVLNDVQIGRILERVWDPAEFLSEYGLRSLSRFHESQPYFFEGQAVSYEPADAVTKMKGGNSNWRGPIWFPTCFLLIESLRKLAKAFGPESALVIGGPGGERITYGAIARSLAERLIRIFARDPASGCRPVYGRQRKMQEDPHWRDLILFYEYFHGDSGAGLGASHQTGWTALVASLIDEWREQ